MISKKNIYPTILTTIQLLSLFYLLVSGPIIADSINGFLIEIAGIFLGLLAIYIMKPGNFNIRPLIKTGGVLITSGPYRIIRHPMYTAQIVAIIPLVAESFSYYRLAVLFILTTVLIIKIEFEEKQLLKHFEGYKEYKKTTKKLIPYIY
ncbi:MAG: hypothetical protein C0598_13265 [Marinilabiliales bacterium]|nr:MAG: hypothetical protein C0598_13265 [Marinilabiliales bacterium]